MKILFGIFFLIFPIITQAQWQDNFDDGDIRNSPAWMGDTMDFRVNTDMQLQLNAGAAGTSFLSTTSTPNMFTELEWHFFIRQNFSPSSGNYGRVYLVSDQQDLRGPLNGYYLQFGESLSNDAVELFRQDGTNPVSVCRATDAAIATAFSISVKVTRSEIGLWTLWIDYSGGTDYIQECYGAEAMYTSSFFFGIYCDYTSGNRSNFYFDDFYVGPILHDTLSPAIFSASIQSSNSLELQFSEAVDRISAESISNYTLDGGMGNPASAVLNSSDPSKVLLNFAGNFLSGYQYHLSLSGIKDLAGNTIASGSQWDFTYFPVVTAEAHDVIFTEIFFEPSSSGGLPNYEFVEIFNRSPQAISLKDWTIGDGTSLSILPGTILLPQTYLILCNTSAAGAFSPYGNSLGLTSFPVLNNDVGDHLQLHDNNGYLIEELSFSDQTYRDGSKDDGGYSLERIDTAFLCTDPLNWMASDAPLGGTPGQKSSISGTYMDYEKPLLLRAALIDSVHLCIVFSEEMDPANIKNPLMYQISGGNQHSVHPDSVNSTDDPLSYILKLPFEADENTYELSVSYGLKDCPGNDLDISQNVRFAMPQAVDSGDVVINEVLFNPQSGGVDFVEIYNKSNKVLDLHRWRIAEAPYDDPATAMASKSICEGEHLFFPDEYRVFSKSTSDLRMRYENPGPKAFISVNDFPDFNSTEGTVVLYDSLGIILDQFSYTEDMHFPLLMDKRGVSLERLNPEIRTQENSNWHSASSKNGFASPGLKNSIAWINDVATEGLSIDPPVFTPDNDGINDLLFIRLKQSGQEGIAQVYIFDIAGRLIRKLAEQNLIGDEFVIVWDGLNERGELASIGLYVLYAEIFNAQGQIKKHKRPFALSMR